MALQHLRSGTANKRPIPTVMSAGQIAINTNEASPGLFFKDSNGDLVKVGPVHIGTSAPNSSPDSVAATALVTGTVYQILTVGTSDFTLVGASANTVGVIFTATGTTTGDGTVSGQQGVEKGEMWLDTTGGNYVLKIYDGTAWRSEAGEFVNVTGDTMTGDLVFNNADIVFEGATADEFETTLTVVDPTADRTITLPDTTGTVVTTGDTGTVTTTMIANGTSRQLLQTNLPGTGVEWTDDVAIPGDLLVVGAAAFTGVVDSDQRIYAPKFAAERGTASAPSFYFDLDTGIYSPGDNQFGVATAGTPRLVIDSSGNVGIGTSTGDAKLTVNSSGARAFEIENAGSSDSKTLTINQGNANNGATNTVLDVGSSSGNSILTTGRVGIGTTSPGVILDVAGSNPTLRVRATTVNTEVSTLRLTEDNSYVGAYVKYDGSTNLTHIGTHSAADSNTANDNHAITIVRDTRNVGIGTSSPGALLDLGTATPILRFSDTDTTGYHQIQSSNANFIINADPSNATANSSISFNVDGDERMRIDSSGRLLVGTSSPRANFYHSIVSPQIQQEGIGDFDRQQSITSSSTTGHFGAAFILAHQKSGTLGGNTALSNQDVSGLLSFQANDGTHFLEHARISALVDGSSGADDMPGALQFWTASDGAQSTTERMRIDSSGRVLVGGTSSIVSAGKFQVKTIYNGALNQQGVSFLHTAFSAADTFNINLLRSRDNFGGNTAVISGTRLGQINFKGYDGTDYESSGASIYAEVDGTPGSNDMPGRLVFSTTADGASSPTERMRISQNGVIDTFSTEATGVFNVRYSSGSGSNIVFACKAAATDTSTGSDRFRVRGDGDCENTNNSYGAISDVKLKENIVDANSQWDDLKAFQIRKYNFKKETGYSTHTQIGVVAQEVEAISPGLVTESPDLDEDSNDLGTVTKSVNYSVLYMKAVKALQEAMERIETLEAKVAALEAN